MLERNLIITADDFGASKNINEGIRIVANNHVITTISALTNFTESISELKKISEDHPKIGIGVHLNIITGKPILEINDIPSLVKKDGDFYTIDEILPKIENISRNELKKELIAQINALIEHEIRIDHLSDQMGILSLYSPFFEIMIELAEQFRVPVRSPVVGSVKNPNVFSHSKMKKRGRKLARKLFFQSPFKAIRLSKYLSIQEMEKKTRKLDERGIPHPDLLIDCFWGNPTTSHLSYILENIPDGTSELILHVGTGTRQEATPRAGSIPRNLQKRFYSEDSAQ